MAVVSANEDNSTTVISDSFNETFTVSSVEIQEDIADNHSLGEADTPDLTININQDNVDDYFVGGTLKSSYAYANLFISEDMDGLGILKIEASNVTINANNHTLKNTVFSIEASGVTLSNVILNVSQEFEDNDNAAILIWDADDVGIYNTVINYIVPRDISAYGIYSEGTNRNLINNLRLINNTVNFIADNPYEGRDFALCLEYSNNAIVENNTVNARLPLRTVVFTGTTAMMYSEFALAVGIGNCDNLTFNNNIVDCEVNRRTECSDPTLDAVFICDSKDARITNNTIRLTDFITYKDEPNYLYALDVYRDDNLLIEGNNIHVETSGGAFAAGTAYPIQLTGPASGVIIQYNDIYSKSNGPNIGIYSQNFNGENYLTILNNHMNITGLAGNHSWALVAGIEAQDDNDVVMNNVIELHNIRQTSRDDNIYGISYSQETDGRHSYRVVNNTVISDGYYLAHMLDADNTTVTNNTLVRTDKYSDTDYDPFKRGKAIGEGTDESKNNDFSGNRVITVFEYGLENQGDEVDGGDEFDYTPPENVNGRTNVINGSGILPDKPGFPGGNPLLPGGNGGGSINTGGNSPGGFNSPDSADGDNGFKGFPDLSGDNGESLSRKTNQGTDTKTVNSFNNDGTASNSYNNNVVASENSTSSETPSVNGMTSSGRSSSSASSAGAGGSSGASQDVSKAYEISKNIVENGPDDILKFIALAVVCEILLVVGYRRKESEDITD
ncbi:right-handed parallel beta-helix repeat-containing protein [uncultured Methanobrevibacter sp.]|uniref:right-handed parallel beta-helix repeat-containing protein n=1 Tax=uncultured Methanobrevibacter sp. TaxID=253161 RepID=UPI0025D282F2|nr:right-handed parallel beta-helix repeat-containing protein [uncultured Methanobrevibacter sp.]